MLQKDYLMRQIQQLTQVLQVVMGLKKQGQNEEAQHAIRQAFGQLDDKGESNLRDRPLEDVLAFCRREGAFQPDLAMRVADLMKEDGDMLSDDGRIEEADRSRTRALLLYRRAMQEDQAAVPWDIGAKLQGLQDDLSEEQIHKVDRLLEDEG